MSLSFFSLQVRRVAFLLSGFDSIFFFLLLTAEVAITYFFFLCIFWRGSEGTKQPWQSEASGRQTVTSLLPKLLLFLLSSLPLPGGALRMADNCLCASCCTCQQPTIETLIIFLIIAKRLVFLPLSSLEEERGKKWLDACDGDRERFSNEVWRRILEAI